MVCNYTKVSYDNDILYIAIQDIGERINEA